LRSIAEKELAHVYHMAECLVFPSLAEGFGIPPMECLAVGTPAIVSADTLSFTERWERDPWVLPSLDPRAVARLISEVLASGSQVSVAPKRQEVQELTWENHAQALLGLISSQEGC
jgi:glycosyltransferase involved in cell wall biosynthesis